MVILCACQKHGFQVTTEFRAYERCQIFFDIYKILPLNSFPCFQKTAEKIAITEICFHDSDQSNCMPEWFHSFYKDHSKQTLYSKINYNRNVNVSILK